MAVQAMAALDSNARIDKKSHDAVVEAKEQLEQHCQSLQSRLQESEAEAAALKSQLSAAASEVDDVRAQVLYYGLYLPLKDLDLGSNATVLV